MTKYSSSFRKKRSIPSLPKVKTMYRRGMENLLKRLLVIFLGLVVYRIGVFIPIPGISPEACSEYFKDVTLSGKFLQSLNRFFGGAWQNASIFSLGMNPYITSSFLMRFLTLGFPKLKELQNESNAGREKINQYMRYLCVLLSVVQGFGSVLFLSGKLPGTSFGQHNLLTMDGDGFQIYFVMTAAFVGGSTFLMWLCEQMTEFGIGNGASFIIFVGLVSNLPSILLSTLEGFKQGSINFSFALTFFTALLFVIYAITFLELSYRKIPIQYAQEKEFQKRLIAMPESYLPLKFNISEIMPVMVSSMLAQGLIFGIRSLYARLHHWSIVRNLYQFVATSDQNSIEKILFLQAPLLIFACFLYAEINFDCKETAEHLKKDKACIPRIRPGLRTETYLKKLVNRIIRLSALYIFTAAYALPYLGTKIWGNNFTLGGVQVLIVIGVVVELLEHIATHIYSHQYETLLDKSQFWKLQQR